ncbi:hypothetical protein [Micromonospora sp. NPDC049891]|uniref:hypothetical protein n=1 Tax=Micromonospora sp. NPDC049891 TaxID=3155655 RepID=UPI0033E548F1
MTAANSYTERVEQAAQLLAHFEGADAFNSEHDGSPDRTAVREQYRSRATALLANAGTPPVKRRPAAKMPTDRADRVLGLSFDRKMTAAHLAVLTPEEITELFQAVYTVAALTELAEKRVVDRS